MNKYVNSVWLRPFINMSLKKAIYIFLLIALAGFTYKMVALTLPYFTFETDVDFLLTKQDILHLKIWRWAFYLHIGVSPIVLIGGILQYSKWLLKNYPACHKTIGKIYVICILFISAPTGLVMAFYANGNWWAKLSFIIISVLWWAFTYLAYDRIRKKDLQQHLAYMTRSYALTLSAITLRIYALCLPSVLFFIGDFYPKIYYIFHIQYEVISWLSWAPNLLMAEWLVRKKIVNGLMG